MKTNLKLQDIQGLDSISFWPLAIGWWILIGLAVVSITYFFWFRSRQRKIRASWKFQTLKQLESLEKNLAPHNSQQTATQLSALIRRLAIHRFSREECASLDGEAWLKWLNQKDPSEFNWIGMARSVMEAPFRPEGAAFDTHAIRETVNATKKWVC